MLLNTIDCNTELVTITVLGQKGKQIRIGTYAPAKYSILREELLKVSGQLILATTTLPGYPRLLRSPGWHKATGSRS